MIVILSPDHLDGTTLHSADRRICKDFHNLQKIGSGSFGKVYRANLKNSEVYFALKPLFNPDNASVREFVHEVI